MGNRVYGSEKRDGTINKHSHREFTKGNCMD